MSLGGGILCPCKSLPTNILTSYEVKVFYVMCCCVFSGLDKKIMYRYIQEVKYKERKVAIQ